MNATKRDLSVIDRLWILEIRGFKPTEQIEGIADHDLPGSANWLVTEYGLARDDEGRDLIGFPADRHGILWTDYDLGNGRPRDFAVLIADDFVDNVREFAEEAGYEIVGRKEVRDATTFGDGNGTVVILKHPEGWIVLD